MTEDPFWRARLALGVPERSWGVASFEPLHSRGNTLQLVLACSCRRKIFFEPKQPSPVTVGYICFRSLRNSQHRIPFSSHLCIIHNVCKNAVTASITIGSEYIGRVAVADGKE